MGNVDEILRQFGAIERCVNDIRMQASAITAVMLCGDMKADVLALRSDLRCMETRIIKWIVGMGIVSAAITPTIAFVVARLVG